MRYPVRGATATLTALAMILFLIPAPAMAGDDARLEGLVIGVDGRPASGYQVHLIDGDGQAVGTATTGNDGVYSFRDMAAGDYAMGIENTEGQIAPTAGPEVHLGQGELARRDVKLMSADAQTRNAALGANYGVGMWWAGLSPAAKVWTVVAVVAVTAITIAAFDSGSSNEPAASDYTPPTR